MATFAELNELYLAYFGRPVDTAGAEFWLTKTPEEIEAGFAASQESQDMYDAGTLEGFITQVYQNVIGRAPEAAGLAHWVGRIESGDITRAGAAIEILHDALATGDAGNVQNKLDAAAAFYAALEASGNGAAYAGADAAAAARAFIAGVFETPVTPEQVAAAVEAVVGGGGGEEPGPEPVPGNEFFLTAGQDVLNGTADNDTFYADVVQNPNNGQQVNSLGSGDRINGGAGTDTLDAEITAGAWVNGDQANSMAIAPRTTSVENIVLKAVHSNISGNQGANTNSEVYVDGKNMVGVQYIGSEQSDANLTVKNMTSEGNGHVSEMTVGMKYTGNKDTHWDASNFKVLFDQDYLTTDSARKTGIFYDILNQDAYDANVNQPLRDYPLGAINFWIRPTGDAGEGTKYTLDVSEADMVGINTHAQLVTLLNGKLAALIATKPELAGLVFQTEGANSFSDTNGRTSVRIDLIDNNAAGRELHKGTVSQAEDSEGGNIYWRRGSLEDEVSQNPVSINVELEKVGLTGRGGELVIGSMNKAGADDNEWKGNSGITVTDTKQGFDEFNVKVLGSNAESSWLSTIRSTNNTLHTINIESAAGKKGGKAGDWADLYVDSIKDIKTLDASAFQGDLTVGAVITDESINKYLGNDLLSGGVSRGARGANDIVKFDYDGGVGDDDIVVSIDGGVILNGYGTYGGWDFNGFLPAARKFEMEIDGNNGDDWIEVNVSPSEGYYSGTVSGVGAATGVSGVDVTWGNGWSGITINGGNGDDVIVLEQDAWTSTSGTLYEEFGWSFNVAFNGNFGLDTIVNFTSGEQEYTNEVQLIDFNGVILHPEYAADPGATPPLAEFKGEILELVIDGKTYQYQNNNGADEGVNQIVALTAGDFTLKGSSPATSLADAGYAFIGDAVTGTVQIIDTDPAKGNNDIATITTSITNLDPLHYNTGETGVSIAGPVADTIQHGGYATKSYDFLDFSAYNVKAVVWDSYDNLAGLSAAVDGGTANGATLGVTAGDATYLAVGDRVIWINETTHTNGLYDVFTTTVKTAATAADDAVFNTATKVGTIQFLDNDGLTVEQQFDASNFIF